MGKFAASTSTNGCLSLTNRVDKPAFVTSEVRHFGLKGGMVSVDTSPGDHNFGGKSIAIPFKIAG